MQIFNVLVKHCFICVEEWPLLSPVLNPFDYFFWGFVKTRVYQGRCKTLDSEDELKKAN